MKTFARRFSYALGAFLVLFLLLAWTLPPQMDWNKYKGQVEAVASSILDQTVKVDGDIALTLLPSPEVTASNVRFVGESDADIIASVDALRLKIDTLAMIGGRLAVSEFIVEKPQMTLTETEGVGWQLEGFTPDAEGSGRGLSLNNVVITDGTLILEPLTGNRGRLDNLNLNFSGTAPDGPWESDGNFAFRQVPISFDARMLPLTDGKSQSLKIMATSGDAELELTGRVMEAGAFNGRMKLKADKASDVGETLWALIDERGPSIMPEEPLFVDLRVDRTVGKIDLTSRRVRLGESEGSLNLLILGQGTRRFSGALGLGQINLDLWNFENARSSDAAEETIAPWGEGLSGDITVSAEALTWHGQLVRQVEMELVASDEKLIVNKAQALVPGGGQLSFGGEMAWSEPGAKFIGRLGINTGRARDFLLWAGVDLSALKPESLMSFGLTADIVSDFDHWRLSGLDAKLDDTSFRGYLSGAYAGTIDAFDLRLDRINLDRYLSGEGSSGEAPLPNSMRFQADQITISGITFSDVSSKAIGKGTALDMEGFEAKALGGRISIAGKADNVFTWQGVNGDIYGYDLSLASVSRAYPALADYLSLYNAPITFALDIEGDSDAFKVASNVTSGQEGLSINGTVSYATASFDTLERVDLVGDMRLASTAPLTGVLQDLGAGTVSYSLKGTNNTPYEISANATFTDVVASYFGTVNTHANNALNGTINFSLGSNVPLVPKVLKYMGEDTLSGSFTLKQDAAQTALSDMDIRYKTTALRGAINWTHEERSTINGAVTLGGDILVHDPEAPSRFAHDWKQTLFDPLPMRHLRGSVAVTLADAGVYGQKLSTDAGQLVFDDNGIAFVAETLMANAAPAKLNLRVNEGAGGSLTLNLALQADKLKYEPFLGRMVGSVVTAAEGPFTITMTGNGRSEHALVRTLRGEGAIASTTGTLAFMDVPKLVASLNSANSRGAFVKGLASVLMGGASDISSLNSTFTIERGVVKLAPLTAVGDWGTLTLPGTFDMAERTVDFAGTVDLAEPKDVTPLGIRFSGSVTSPKPNYDMLSLIAFADRTIGERMKRELAAEQKEALEANGGEVEPTGKLFDKVKEVLKKTKPKEEPKATGTAPSETGGTQDLPIQMTE